jgi:hypothetical protein
MDGQGGARVKPEVMEEPASKRPRTADEQNLLESMQAEIKALKDQLATTGGGGAGAGSAKVKKEVELPPATFDLGGTRKLQGEPSSTSIATVRYRSQSTFNNSSLPSHLKFAPSNRTC